MDAKAAAVVVVVGGDGAVVFDCAVTRDKKRQLRRRLESMLTATRHRRDTMFLRRERLKIRDGKQGLSALLERARIAIGAKPIRPGDLPLLASLLMSVTESLAGQCLLAAQSSLGQSEQINASLRHEDFTMRISNTNWDRQMRVVYVVASFQIAILPKSSKSHPFTFRTFFWVDTYLHRT